MKTKTLREEIRDDLLMDIRVSLDRRIRDKKALLIRVQHEEYWDEILHGED